MLPTAIDQKVCRGFSNAASRYDRLTELHRGIGSRLMARMKRDRSFRAILDIGMGTGWYTHQLAHIFPEAMVVGMDFAPGMVSFARKRKGAFKIVRADAYCLPFQQGVFDGITSNLSYQWIEDMPKAFAHCRSLLNKKGGFYMTMFGHDTFCELFSALDACAGGNNGLTIRRLADKECVSKSLKSAGFNVEIVETERIKAHFPDMMSLIKWIKDIGANTLTRDVYMGKELLLKAGEYYRRNFGDSSGVYATFEVIWVEARR